VIVTLAWGDPASPDEDLRSHALVAAGHHVGGSYWFLSEAISDAWDSFVDLVIGTKDRLLPEYVYGPSGPLLGDLQSRNGLMMYQTIGKDIANRPIYKERNPKARWPDYRNETTLVVGVPEKWAGDLSVWHAKAGTLHTAGKVQVSKAWCGGINRQIDKPRDDAIKRTLFQAYLTAIAMLEYHNLGSQVQEPDEPDNIPNNWGGYL
jgi:hypothetical protein